MTKQEFKNMVEDILEDIQDPDGEFAGIVKDAPEEIAAVALYDQGMADRMKVIIDGFVELGRYVKQRAEVCQCKKAVCDPGCPWREAK